MKDADSPEKVAGFLKERHIAGYGGAKAAVTGGKEIEDSNKTSNYDCFNDIAINRDGLNQYMGRERAQGQASQTQPQTDQPQAQASESRPPAVLKHGSAGQEVWGLQTTLHGLGYRGADGQPLKMDGDFGSNTDKAVRDFQRDHGLEPVDGKVGKDTRAALVRAAEYPLVSEAIHPNHKLYAAIGSQLPAGTDPKAIANVTMQALENGITGPDRIAAVQVWGSDVTVFSTTPGFRPQVDLAAPTSDLQSMSDHMA